jgi:hypothetical protein
MSLPRVELKSNACQLASDHIIERPLAVHLQVCHKGIPICGSAESGPGTQIYACLPEGRRNEGGRGFAVGTKCFAVQEHFRIKFPGTPTVQDAPHRRVVNAQETGHNTQIRRKRDDCSDIEIAVGPTILTVADAGDK